ncbi:MAG: DUF2306 domain-containing protein [Bacteroidota bacterium]
MRKMQWVGWITMAVLAVLIGLYPFRYLIFDWHIGLPQTKSAELLASIAWRIGFFTHILIGGIALLIGWAQFNPNWRIKYPKRHRQIGMVYMICVLLSGTAACGIALAATGGLPSMLGFLGLGIVWLATTVMAFQAARRGDFIRHQDLMTYSYACCLGAVTLRIWMPILIPFLGFNTAYPIIAWISWVPNLIVAWWIIRERGTASATLST